VRSKQARLTLALRTSTKRLVSLDLNSYVGETTDVATLQVQMYGPVRWHF
jgi:hypothetical protein